MLFYVCGSPLRTGEPAWPRSVEEQSVSGCDIKLGLRRTVCDCVSSIPRGHCKKAASLRAAEQQAVCAMAAELHFSPPEIPEPTLMENVLRYGLFFGAVFQLLCVLAIILPFSKSAKTDSDGFESKTWETVKKPKASAAQLSKKAKKESKKKR